MASKRFDISKLSAQLETNRPRPHKTLTDAIAALEPDARKLVEQALDSDISDQRLSGMLSEHEEIGAWAPSTYNRLRTLRRRLSDSQRLGQFS